MAYVKFKTKGAKTWKFMTPKGGGSRLRIHAARFSAERASTFVADLAEYNPDFDFKIVEA